MITTAGIPELQETEEPWSPDLLDFVSQCLTVDPSIRESAASPFDPFS